MIQTLQYSLAELSDIYAVNSWLGVIFTYQLFAARVSCSFLFVTDLYSMVQIII